jgi:DNA polymerase I-like protein with 3'-5' exonuclease and polymerase domains
MNPLIVHDDFTFKAMLVNHKPVGAVDIETTVEENPWSSPPQLVSVAITFDGRKAWVFKNDKYLERARQMFAETQWIMHNGLFDRLMMSYFWDYDLPLKHDTMAMQYLLDPDKPKGLQDLSVEYLGLEEYKDVDYHKILEEPWEKVAAMNGEDVLRTYNLVRPLGDQLNKDKALSRVYQWVMMPAINNLIEITQTGIPLQGERLAKVTDRTEKEVEDLLTELREATPLPWEEMYPKGWPRPSNWRVNDVYDKETGEFIREGDGKWDGTQFNPGSTKQVQHIIFDQWSLTPLEYNTNDDGEVTSPSTNADVLLRIETYEAEGAQQEWLHQLRAYRKASKLLTYFHAWPHQTDPDGWLHPRYRPLKTVTGRLASDSPNIQNVPRQKEVRSCFGHPDYTWMKADYSQIELRLAALAADEDTILQAYREGADIHRLTAKLVLDDDSDEARQVGKTLNFGLLYGAGPATLQRVARSDYNVFLTLDEARYYKEQFFRAYPGLAQWHAQCESEIAATGISRSPLGRVRYLPKAKIPASVQDMWSQKMGAIREGINHRIQSFASDMLLMSLNNLVPKLPDYVKVVAEVHDEIDLLIPNDRDVSQVAGIVKATMEDVSWLRKHGIKLGVPVVADIEIGPNWGDLKGLEV